VVRVADGRPSVERQHHRGSPADEGRVGNPVEHSPRGTGVRGATLRGRGRYAVAVARASTGRPWVGMRFHTCCEGVTKWEGLFDTRSRVSGNDPEPVACRRGAAMRTLGA